MEELINELVKYLLAALISAVLGLVVQMFRKQGIELSAERHAQLEAIAQQAVLVIEEKATSALKAGLKQISPEEKLQAAVQHVVAKLPRVSQEQAAEVVLAELPKVRAAMVGFTTAVVKKATTRKGGRK